MFRAVLKLTYASEASDLMLPGHSELQARLLKQGEPKMLLPPAGGPAGY